MSYLSKKKSKMKWYMKKHLQRKYNIFFWFQVGDFKISDIFYKIQKFLWTSLAIIITTNGINYLMAGPFGNLPKQVQPPAPAPDFWNF